MADQKFLARHFLPRIASEDGVDRAVRNAVLPGETRLRFSSLESGDNRSDIVQAQAGVRSSANVLASRDEFEMVGVHAASHPTEMVDLQPVGDGAVSLEPSVTMSGRVSISVNAAVAVLIQATKKYPAWRSVAAILWLPKRLEGTLRSSDGRVTAFPSNCLTLDPSALRAGLRRDPCRLTTSALAQLRSKVLVHAASSDEVVNGERGSDRPRFPHSIGACC